MFLHRLVITFSRPPKIPIGVRLQSTIRFTDFGFIGRIEPEKGIEILLQATRYLSQPGWRVKIAGKGTDDYVSYLRAKYADERIEWLGFTTASEFYPNVDVVVIPSQWDEPLGMYVSRACTKENP